MFAGDIRAAKRCFDEPAAWSIGRYRKRQPRKTIETSRHGCWMKWLAHGGRDLVVAERGLVNWTVDRKCAAMRCHGLLIAHTNRRAAAIAPDILLP